MGWQILRDPATGERLGDITRTPEAGPPLEAPKPVGTTLAGGVKMVFTCLACDTAPRFKIKAIGANHFRKHHEDLCTDSDVWREYIVETPLE